ncbi:MAG: hypothetical protein NC421_01045 [Lachnospiraceae bacterium]|nr:hypothetical protein [Lachnospiraceae bacterium]
MNNTMKNRVVNAVCCLPEWGDGSVEVKNLRRGKGGLVPAGVPAVECVNPGGKMIGMAWGKPLFLDGRRVLWMNGGVLRQACGGDRSRRLGGEGAGGDDARCRL